MSDYWKKKLDELNQKNKKSSSASSGDYWEKKMTELEESKKKKKKDDDIAPVVTSAKKSDDDKDDGLKFFQKGAFEDGYQFGDVSKALLGTGVDIGTGIVKGVAKLGEGIVDAGSYGLASIADKFGNDDYANELRVKAKENAIDNTFQKWDDEWGKYSLLGKTSDAISEGVGQVGSIILTGGLAGAAGLGAVGATAATTGVMGVSSIGSGMSEAYQSGATDEEAATYGLVKGVVDAGSELLFGGLGKAVKAVGLSKGLTSFDDVVARKLSEKVTSHVTKNLVQYGVKASAEGVEEVIAGVGSAMAKQATYMSDKELSELLADENLLEQFVVGAVTSGVAQSGIVPGTSKGSLKESIETGRDFISGLSANEQKVIDKELENRIAEAEKDGKKLTNKEKNKLYDAVVSDMDKGYISTDTIEEVLGGDTYKSYKDLMDSEDALAKEYDELGKKQNATLAEQTRYNELHEQMKNKDDSQRNELKSRLSGEVMSLVQSDRLAESYNERSRRGQAFEADVSQYNEKQRDTIQRAIDSGILNNTRRTHEFVDMVAKITADKGVSFDFTNNEKLKGSGFAVDGKTVNGFVTKDGVTLNIDSAKSLNSVVGHEITHVLEGTELYTELQNLLFRQAKTKGEYTTRLNAIEKLYEGVEGADAKAELTADLVGDYLFTDADFVNSLSTGNRNVFQKIYDEIKYMCKVATAGSKEARALEKVKHAFEQAYKADNKAQSDTKYSISDSNGKQLSQEQQDYFKDSKVRDENGNLKVMYHGTSKGGHTIFDTYGSNYGLFGSGSYFTDNKGVAEKYTEKFNKRGSGEKRVYETYLNIKNPMDMDASANPAEWSRLFPDASFPESGTNEEFFRAMEEYFYDEMMSKWEVADEVMDALIAMGFDGITHIGGGRFNQNDDTRHRVYIAFHPEQIKNIDNAKPTNSPDIRFSLSKSVEETKDLVALHNLTEDKLTKSLELGGLPMPSLAITKADIPHDNFGEITLIFGKDTIDPKKNKKNKVYSADAWTPVFPRVEYEADSKVENRVSQKLRDLEGRIDDSFHRDIRKLQYGFEDYLNSQGGEEGLIQYAMDNYGLKAAYLEEHGTHIEKVTVQEEVDKGFNPDSAGKYQKIMDILGVSTAEEIGNVNLKDARDNHGAELEAVYPGITKNASRMGRLFGVVKSYLEYKDSGPVYKTVTDSTATRKSVDDALDQAGYETWVRDLFTGIVKDSGVYNNKDLFTPAGNRRSFKQTHLPVTLENIVKAMAGQNNGNAKNVSGFNGVKTLRASTAETFKSIAEIHQKKGRLQNLTQEQFEEVHDALQTRLYKVIETIDSETSKHGESNPFIRFDSIGEILTEIGENGKYNVTDIQNIFKHYSRDVNDNTAMEVKQLLYDIAQMPVNIFEAKPERVVRFEEAAVFVIPNNVDAKLKQELLNRGYSIAEYDPNVEGDRQRVVNGFEEYKFSLSNVGEQPTKHGKYNVYGKDIALEIAPVSETTAETKMPVSETKVEPMFPDDLTPMSEPMPGQFDSLTDADAPPEMDAPYYGDESEPNETGETPDPMSWRYIEDVGNQKVKAYMYENPEVKPFFQAEAEVMLRELQESTKGERWFNDQLYYESGGEHGWGGSTRNTSADIAYLLDGGWGGSGYTYAEIEKGLKAIIEDNGKENNACSKRIEFILNDRLRNGYTDFRDDTDVPANENYLRLIEEKQITEYSEEAFDAFMASAESYEPPVDNADIAPVAQHKVEREEHSITERYEAIRPKRETGPRMARATPAEQARAEILTEEPETLKKENKAWSLIKNNVLDKGMVFEDLSLATGNRELQARWNSVRYAEGRAQRLMEKGNDSVPSLKSIREEVEQTGKTKEFYEYLYHLHNADRMSLEDRYENTPNKPVFGYGVTANESLQTANNLEAANPEFKQYAQDVYRYMNHLRGLLVKDGVISRETANLWAEMYPHYVPIRREGDEGLNINVPLDTGKTGVNAPVKRATGGSRNILPLFDTMAMRTEQTYKAIAKNRFGVELKNTLGTTIGNDTLSLDETIDSIDAQDSLLQEGKNGQKPTFTVFENGERITFEITDEMYDAMKPKSKGLAYTNKPLNALNNVRRDLLTEYNPAFMLTNPIKDTQDVLINSQHPAKTYANYPKAIAELWGKKGRYYSEYMENGGEQNTYFDGETKTFADNDKGIPFLRKISEANNFIERIPRMAEYIASREAGRSIDVSMLDAARVTTNFAAGGDLTKMLNRNGFTFLNASVQGAVQQVRNVREAKAEGLKGWAKLTAKATVAGLAPLLLNHLLWDDDEEYEDLSDYVKQNYYIVGKYDDGKFVRIPKGRTLAVIQNAFEQMENLLTGNDEVDFETFAELVISNLAPNNPLENNIIAPFTQAFSNRAWYGDEIIPSRLKDKPSEEQYDETTDKISKWLGEHADPFDLGPYRINYLLDQYSGAIGDTFLPMITPEAERGDNTLLAPILDKFTTDGVLKNQNVSDFYTKKDELTVTANGSKATDTDILRSKYMNSVNAEMGKLYGEKRDIQNSDKPDAEKYNAVRDIQKQIDELAKTALESYDDISTSTFKSHGKNLGEYAEVSGKYFKRNKDGEWESLSADQTAKYLATRNAGNAYYATDGTNHYRWYTPGEDAEKSEPGWEKISDDDLSKQKKVTKALGISASKYWGNKAEYDFAYKTPGKYAISKSVGGYDKYTAYKDAINDIEGVKDANGDTISGTKKENVTEYINSLDISYGERIILYRSMYSSKADKNAYNADIVEYLNSRDDISYDEMVTILEELEMTVHDDGTVTW